LNELHHDSRRFVLNRQFVTKFETRKNPRPSLPKKEGKNTKKEKKTQKSGKIAVYGNGLMAPILEIFFRD
jgi:hypothetical protein